MMYRHGPGGAVPMEYPTHTVPRNYHYGPAGGYDDYRGGPPSETYPSLSRGVGRLGSAMELSAIPRFVAEPYGLEDDQRSIGYDEPDYGMAHPMHYSTVPPLTTSLFVLCRSYEGALDGDLSGGDLYYFAGGAPLAQGERGSMASLDTLRKGPPTGGWRQPELSEVIAMLNYRLDPVRSNAAAYLQHLTFRNDAVRRLLI
ncbi:hypothetical protein XENOCAPTIV_000174 [Xenoophorus captivus]|uniref:Uncharacterized protein n=1 Tax=Xenoophorus captivus TaxID=1517983 RepID=A0ABV0R5X3_9TELE